MSATATTHARSTADEATRQAARAVQQQKMSWVKAVGADPAISSGAARVAVMAALNLAYSTGHIRASRKHLGKLSGLSDATVKRAVAELAEQNYWKIDHTIGGASLYTLIMPAGRLELWLEEESGHKEACEQWLIAERAAIAAWISAEKWFTRRWLDAEKGFVQTWLDAEKQFTQEWLDAERQFVQQCIAARDAQDDYQQQVFNALHQRGVDVDSAFKLATTAWALQQHRHLPLVDPFGSGRGVLEMIASAAPGSGHQSADPGSPVTRGRVNGGPGVGSPERRGGIMPDSLTCENDRSTSTYKSDKLEVSTSNASPTGRALLGAPSGNAQETSSTRTAPGGQARPEVLGCRLCDDNGRATRLDNGQPIALVLSVDSPDWDNYDVGNNERPFMCTHSVAGNMRRLKRLVDDVDGEWAPAWTGYGEEIDGPDYDE